LLTQCIIAMFVDKNGDYESLLVVVIVLAVIALVAIIAGVILLVLHIKLRDASKRSYCFYFLRRNTNKGHLLYCSFA